MNFLGQTTIIKSIGVLSKNLYKKKLDTVGFILLSLLLGAISLFIFSACAVSEMKIESGNIPYFCSMIEIIKTIIILMLTIKILLTKSESEKAKKYILKDLITWIITFIAIVMVSKLIDILVIRNFKLSFYNIIGRTNEFALARAGIMYLSLSIILSISIYLLGYRIFSFAKNDREVSMLSSLKSFFRNIIAILIFWLLAESIQILSLIFIVKHYILCGAICAMTASLYLALVVSTAYVSVEDELHKYNKNIC